jgi:adenine-specific DNA methylase
MIPKECKRLAEVDFPIAVVSKHSAREKSIRHGHPSTLHLWWARRPLAACRAMLLALLLPDPCDPHCPDDFKKEARKILAPLPQASEPDDDGLRRSLLRFIGDFANWDLSSNPMYLEASRALVKSAHPEETPLVVDPFAGGGSIPLEALRIGCDAFASDLNPVACLILKVMLEDIPRHGPELAEKLRRVGKEIKEAAEKELAEFYPKDPDGATPIAYLWARTVRCESPKCGAEIPLMRSFWLCKKASRKRALRYKVIRPTDAPPRVEFEIFAPKSDKEVSNGTVTRAKATCLCCNMVLPPERVRAQLAEQRGGADAVFDANGLRIGGSQLLAVVTLQPSPSGRGRGEGGRHYRLPIDQDYQAVWKAQKRLKSILDEWEKGGKIGLCPVPDEPTPAGGGSGAGRAFGVQKYGMMHFSDLFTARQKLGLTSFCRKILEQDGMASELTLNFTKLTSGFSSLSAWRASTQDIGNMFERIGLGMCWDFAEAQPLSGATRGWDAAVKNAVDVIARLAGINGNSATVQLSDATHHSLPDESVNALFTDPPYYDAIPYADLSDYYFVWHKRILRDTTILVDPFDNSNSLTPKNQEIVQDDIKLVDGKPKDRLFFEKRMGKAFEEGRRVLRGDGIGCVVFAHKTTEGWEALLSGIIRGGLTITGSWPIATEMGNRLRALDSAALATSVHLVCRPRMEDAPVGDWGDVLRELPKRVGDWMERLQNEGVRGADLVFACIGPALEIYSRYSQVEDAEGRLIPLGGDPEARDPHKRGYLAYVWETVGRIALQNILGTAEAKARNGMAGVLEEDARLTALFLWTLQSSNGQSGSTAELEEVSHDDEEDGAAPKVKTKGFSLVFDVARRFAQPLGIDLPKWENRIIETQKGVVRLLAVSERAKQLFGEDGTDTVADWIESDPRQDVQQMLFPELAQKPAPRIRGRGRRQVNIDPAALQGEAMREATTLDRVHAAMLLQAGGQANALRALIKSEQDRGPDFLRLANALSALYPKGSEEKRLLDAMLLAVPR